MTFDKHGNVYTVCPGCGAMTPASAFAAVKRTVGRSRVWYDGRDKGCRSRIGAPQPKSFMVERFETVDLCPRCRGVRSFDSSPRLVRSNG